MLNCLLHDMGLNYDNSYKTIDNENYASINVALKCGYIMQYPVALTKYWRTKYKVDNSNKKLYRYSKESFIK